MEAGPSSTSLVTAENTPPPLTASGIETSPPSLSSTGIDSDRYHHLPPGTSTSASSTSTSQPINRNLIPGSQDTSIAGFGNPSIEMSVSDSVHLPTTVIASASNEEGHFDTVLSPAVDDPFQYPAINEQSIPPPTRSRRSGKKREACEPLCPPLVLPSRFHLKPSPPSSMV